MRRCGGRLSQCSLVPAVLACIVWQAGQCEGWGAGFVPLKGHLPTGRMLGGGAGRAGRPEARGGLVGCLAVLGEGRKGKQGGGEDPAAKLPQHVRAELSALGEEERLDILRAVGLAPSKKKSGPKQGRKSRVKPKETSAERRARRNRREEEKAGKVAPLAKGVRVEQQRKKQEQREKEERKEAAAAEPEEEEEGGIWEEVDVAELSEREQAFFSDEKLAGGGGEGDLDFLKGIFGDTVGATGPGAGAGLVDEGVLERENEEKKARDRAERAKMQEERRRLKRDDAGGDRSRFQMVFPDETDIDPYNPQTFGYMQVGFVRGSHGVRGEVNVDSSGISDFALERLAKGKDLFVQLPGKRAPRPWRCVSGRRGSKPGVTIVKLKGVTTREQSTALRGSLIFVRDTDVDAQAGEGGGGGGDADREYFVHELVGMRVVLPDEGGRVLGECVGVVTRDELTELTMKGQELLEVRFGDPSQGYVDDEKALRVLIPFVPPIVPLVDLEGRQMHITPPEGLLDLAQPPPPRKVVIRGLFTEWGMSSYWSKEGRKGDAVVSE